MDSSSQTALPADLPNFSPDDVKSSGMVIPKARSSSDSSSTKPRFRLIMSMPAVMFPHWSLPPSYEEFNGLITAYSKVLTQPYLYSAFMVLIQVPKVISLKQLVREFGEANALCTFDSTLDT